MRYAGQIDRLVTRKGRKWKKIHAIRARQRRVLALMLDRPAWGMSRALRRVKPYVLGASALAEYENGTESAQVYVHVHPSVRHAY